MVETGVAARCRSLESEVHVWTQRTDSPLDSDHASRLHALLDAGEVARSNRFVREVDRRHFLVAHGLLRRALSQYADVAAPDWRFTANRWGRPEISGPSNAPALRFSLSHTAGLVACAVAVDCDCGLDVESLARRGDPLRVAPRVLTPAEIDDIRSQTAGSQRERFLSYWTLKEATTKALGTGLTFPLREISFSLEADGIRFDSELPSLGANAFWQFDLMRPTQGHLLALAVRRRGGPARTLMVQTGPPVAD